MMPHYGEGLWLRARSILSKKLALQICEKFNTTINSFFFFLKIKIAVAINRVVPFTSERVDAELKRLFWVPSLCNSIFLFLGKNEVLYKLQRLGKR